MNILNSKKKNSPLICIDIKESPSTVGQFIFNFDVMGMKKSYIFLSVFLQRFKKKKKLNKKKLFTIHNIVDK